LLIAMPFKSKAQRRKFAELLVQGEISPETYEEWNRSTGRKELPERVRPARKAKRAKAKKRATVKKRATTKKRASARTRAGTRRPARKRR
jgi:hypothetical protein